MAADGKQATEADTTVHFGDLALASTVSADGEGARTQVLRRQSDGTWKRIIDGPRPELGNGPRRMPAAGPIP